jgi:hypothetical protein
VAWQTLAIDAVGRGLRGLLQDYEEEHMEPVKSGAAGTCPEGAVQRFLRRFPKKSRALASSLMSVSGYLDVDVKTNDAIFKLFHSNVLCTDGNCLNKEKDDDIELALDRQLGKPRSLQTGSYLKKSRGIGEGIINVFSKGFKNVLEASFQGVPQVIAKAIA